MFKTAYRLSRNFMTAKFTSMLFVLTSLILLSPYTYIHEFVAWSVGFLTNVIIVVVAYLTRQQVGQFYLFIILAVMNALMHIVSLVYPTPFLIFTSGLFFLIFCVAAVLVFYTEILNSEVVTRDTISGAVCIYLLMGVAFGTGYSLIESIIPGSFSYLGPALKAQTLSQFDFFYFSFITLTTVGYGDIVATAPFAKSIVILESIIGIFYLAILVARLVATRT